MKLRVLLSTILGLGMVAAIQVAADENEPARADSPVITASDPADGGQIRDSEGGGSSGSSGGADLTEPAPAPEDDELLLLRQRLGEMVEAGEITDEEAQEIWEDETAGMFPDGDDVVVIQPAPAPEPMPDPAMDELIDYRRELAERVDAGELTWDEAIELFQERAGELGLGDVISGGDRDGDIERLLDDFRRELDLQVQAGDLSPEEAERLLVDYMVELGLVHVIDGRPVDPAEPPPLPEVDAEFAIERLHGLLAFLVEHEALTVEQVREQVDAFARFLESGQEETLPHPGMDLTMDQAELVYIARDFAMWYDADEFEIERLHEELLHIAMDLGIIEGEGVTRPEPRPNPNEEKLLALREDLARQVEEGLLTEEEAKQLFYETAEDLGLIGEDGTVVILPAPDTPPEHRPRPMMPPDYEPTPEELEMMELLHELALLVEAEELTPDEAWERLTALAADLGWDLAVGGPDVEDPGVVDRDVETPDVGAPEAPDATGSGGVLLTLRSDLASRVQDEDLSGGDAWGELNEAFGSQDDAAAGEGTAIQATTWGAVKASMR